MQDQQELIGRLEEQLSNVKVCLNGIHDHVSYSSSKTCPSLFFFETCLPQSFDGKSTELIQPLKNANEQLLSGGWCWPKSNGPEICMFMSALIPASTFA